MKTFSPGESCRDLKLQGLTLSGYYQVHSHTKIINMKTTIKQFAFQISSDNDVGPPYQTTYCDFEQSLESPAIQSNQLPPVKFEVYHQGEQGVFNLVDTMKKVPFDHISYNYGWPESNINLASSEFTVPYSGTYQLHFQGHSTQYAS